MMQFDTSHWNIKHDGGYELGGPRGLKIMVKKKPMWLHRKMMKWCLGWEWIDN